MPGERCGQMLVGAVLIVGLLVMSLLIAAYQAHVTFLRARGLVAREMVGAITADFNRAVATMLALATRSYYDNARFYDFTSKFESYGLKPRDLESVRRVARRYIDAWADVQRIAYAEQGIQLWWRPCVSDVSFLLGRSAYVLDLFLIDWNKTDAGSYICAQMRLNLTNAGFYNWVSYSLIGLTLRINEVRYERDAEAIKIWFRLLVDNGTYYGLLLAKGWMEIYYLSSDGRVQKLSSYDVTYCGLGYYNVTLKRERTNVNNGDKILIIVSDDRGILVLGQGEITLPTDDKDGKKGTGGK